MSLETMKCDECGKKLIIEQDRIYCPEYYNEALGKKMDDHDAYNNSDGQYDSYTKDC
jgi:hypothetical protein